MTLFVIRIVGFFLYFETIYTIQNLYILKPERCDFTYDEMFYYNVSYSCKKISRNELVFNINFITNVSIITDDDGQLFITGYQFLSNEYRRGPIQFKMGLCSAINGKDFDIPQMFSQSNAKCPYLKGNFYYVENLHPNATNLPKLIPDGRWKLEIKLIYKNKYVMGTFNWYTRVEYPISFPKFKINN